MTVYDTIALVLLFCAALPVNFYPIVFGFTTPWRMSPMGRPMLEATVGLALLVDLSLTFRLFGEYPGLDGLRLAAFAVIVLGAWDKSIQLARQKARELRRRRVRKTVEG